MNIEFKKAIYLLDNYFYYFGYKKEIEFENEFEIYIYFQAEKCRLKFILPKREMIPDILFHLESNSSTIEDRKTYYQILNKIKDQNYILNSFFLSEILAYNKKDYLSQFKELEETESIIKKFLSLINDYALSILNGNEKEFRKLEKWFRKNT